MNIINKIHKALKSYTYNNRTKPTFICVSHEIYMEIKRSKSPEVRLSLKSKSIEIFGLRIIRAGDPHFLGFGSDCSNSLGEQNAN